jgi:hypothetical protein
MTLVFSQAAPFTGAAYQYLRADDALPSHREIADQQDPLPGEAVSAGLSPGSGRSG